jgi:hypothetical protein
LRAYLLRLVDENCEFATHRLPTLNAGKPWSEEDLADLNDMRSPSMRREVLEVEAKIAERFG